MKQPIRKQTKTNKPEPSEIVYECTYNGCRNRQPEPGRCQHGRAQVEMRRLNFPRNSRTDSFAGGGGKAFNSYQE